MKKTIHLLAMLVLSLLYSCECPQVGYAQTTPVVVASTVACATSTDGSVVGVANPLNTPLAAVVFSGTLPAGNYFVKIAWYDAAGHVTLASPETQIQLLGTGALQINHASGMPAIAAGMNVYIGTASGAETLQGQSAGGATFTQSSPLSSGAALPSTNTTVCAIVANDAGWPTGTGYSVNMTTPAGDVVPGYPMQWQLLGPGTTLNLGQGLPLYNGTVSYPIPLLARPYNHAGQSISGPLSMTGYNLTQVGMLGVGTSVPGWPIDVENGAINVSGGYIYNGGIGITTGECLVAGSDAYHTFGPGACYTPPTLFYQTAQAAGTALPQEAAFNVLAPLSAVNNASNHSTDIGLPEVGTAGTYASPSSVTFDAYGRETAVTASSAVARSCNSYGCYRIEADGTIMEWGVATGCAGGACGVSVVFPHAFTTTTNLSITTTSAGGVANYGTIATDVSTTGFQLQYGPYVFVGGTGSNLTGSQVGSWFAIGY